MKEKNRYGFNHNGGSQIVQGTHLKLEDGCKCIYDEMELVAVLNGDVFKII